MGCHSDRLQLFQGGFAIGNLSEGQYRLAGLTHTGRMSATGLDYVPALAADPPPDHAQPPPWSPVTARMKLRSSSVLRQEQHPRHSLSIEHPRQAVLTS